MSALQLAAVFAALADAAVKGTVILVAAWAATSRMRHRSAAARHLVWVVALASMLVLPLATSLLPAWRIVPVPAPLRPAAAFVAAPSAAPAVDGAPVTPRAEPSTASPTSAASRAAESSATPTAGVASAFAPASSSPETPFDWKAALLWLWAAGAVWLAARLALALGRVWWMRMRATEITDDAWVHVTDGLARRLRVGRMVTLLREAHAVVPMTWGIVRPVVLLPADAEAWSTERRTVVLAHELAHVRRWDTLTQWVAHLALALFWFHPLVWMAARRMREEREHACDDAVLSIGTRPVAYADHLLDIVRSLGRAEGPVAALAMARQSQFEGRLLAILDGAKPRGGVTRGVGLAALVLAAVAVLPLAALRAAQPETAHASALAAGPAASSASAASLVSERAARQEPRGVFARLAGNVGAMLNRAADALPLRGDTADRPAAEVTAKQANDVARALNVPPAQAAEMMQEGGGYADVLRAANGIAFSGEKANVLLAVLRRPDVGQADQVLLLRVAATVSSSGDRAGVLREFAERQPLRAAAVRDAWFATLVGMPSDGDRRATLLAMLARQGQAPEAVSAAVAATTSMASSEDRRDVLATVLARPVLTSAQLVEVINAGDKIPSSSDRRDLLLRLLARPALPQEVLAAAFRAAGHIPSSTDLRDVLVTAAARQRVEGGAARNAYLAAADSIASGSDRATALSALLGPGAAAVPPTPAPVETPEQQTPEVTLITGTHVHDHESGSLWSADVGISSDDGSRMLRVVAKDVTRGDEVTDIRAIRPGGRLLVEETRDGHTRRAELVPAGTALRATYTVDGQPRDFEREGRPWMNSILRELIRK